MADDESTQDQEAAWDWRYENFGLRSMLNKNLTIDSTGSEPGRPLELHWVHGGDNQQWRIGGHMDPLVRGSYVNVRSGMCINARWNGDSNHTPIQQYWCDGTEANSFGFTELGEIRKNGTDMCLDVPGGNAYPGAQLQLYQCNGSMAQRWSNCAIPSGNCH